MFLLFRYNDITTLFFISVQRQIGVLVTSRLGKRNDVHMEQALIRLLISMILLLLKLPVRILPISMETKIMARASMGGKLLKRPIANVMTTKVMYGQKVVFFPKNVMSIVVLIALTTT